MAQQTAAQVGKAWKSWPRWPAAQQAGDWAAYGAYLDELAAYLNQMAPQEEAAAVLPEDGALEEPAAEGSALEEPALETPAAQ